MILNPDVIRGTYSVIVTCEINPTSAAEYCNVYARNDNTVFSSELLLHMLHCVHKVHN